MAFLPAILCYWSKYCYTSTKPYQKKILIPKNKENSESLLDILYKNDIKNKKIILLQGENGRKLIQKELIKQNINVSVIECYKRFFKTLDGIKEGKKWRGYEINSLLVTSSEIIYRLNSLFSYEDRYNWLFKCKILVIGERLSYLAKNIGWNNIACCQYANNKYLLKFINDIRYIK